MMYRHGLALVLWLAASMAWAQAPMVHRITGGAQQVLISNAAWMLEDPDGQLDATAVDKLAAAGRMTPTHDPRIAGLRFQPGRAVWLRFEIAPDAQAAGPWLLEIGRPYIDKVRLFARTGQGAWEPSTEIGAAVPFSARAISHGSMVFPVQLAAGTTTTLLLRAQYPGIASVTATLWRPAAIDSASRLFVLTTALYLGLAAGLLFYNVLLYVAIRDRGYLLYAANTAFLCIAVAATTGLGPQFVWGEATWWTSHSLLIGFGGAMLFATLLTRHFLMTAQRLPRTDRVLLALAGVSLLCMLIATTQAQNIAGLVLLPTTIAGVIFLSSLSVVGVVRRWPGAVYFCAAWFAAHCGVMATFARHFRLVPENLLTNNSLVLGSAVELVLLSFALAARINEEKRQKEQAQSLTVAILQASQALDKETRVDGLQLRVCEIVAGLTGATTVRFVVWDPDNNDWFVSDPGAGGGRVPLEEAARRGLVDSASLQQVRQTRQPYETANGSLVLPVMHHGAISAALVMEHAAGMAGFAPAAREALQGIAGPLAVSLENVLLYERLEQHVAERTRELRETQQELVTTARRAGMAEIATNVLHNVGNTLNSVNVAAELMRSRLDQARSSSLSHAVELLESNRQDIGAFMQHDERGRALPGYLRLLADALEGEREELRAHLSRLTASVDHIKRVVATQQAYAGPSVITEQVVPADLFEDALRIAGNLQDSKHLEVIRRYGDIGAVQLDKTRVLQILINLLDNARHAISDADRQHGVLIVETEAADGQLRFRVSDNGCGIDPDHLVRVFSHGFTTRQAGHGFGLHGCATAAGEMAGRLSATSDGPGKGASFTLELPLVMQG